MSTVATSYQTGPAGTTPHTGPDAKIYVNSGYIRSLHGLLKIAHMVLSIILFICAMSSTHVYHNHSNYLAFVSMAGFWTSGILLFLYVINVVTFLEIVPWVKLEFCYTLLMTIFSLVAGIVAGHGVHTGFDAAYGAAAFFSFVLMLVYAANAFILFQLIRQGVRLVTTETTTITS